MTSVYSDYFSDEELSIRKKEFYTTRHGFPNRKAFLDFTEKLEGDEKYHLVCVNVDLRKANLEGYDYGNFALRRFIYSVLSSGILVFHITGEKFNFLCLESQVVELMSLLDKPSDDYEIYYGIISERYTKEKSQEQVRAGMEKMYRHKAEKKAKRTQEGSSAKDVRNELKETRNRKYRKTMWYSIIELTTMQPKFQTVKVFIFPTEYIKPLATIRTIVVVDDAVEYRLYSGKSITFGVGGIQFSVSCRFDRSGLLNVGFFKISEGQCEYEISTHKGVGIPVNFGKVVADGKEIYPIRENINGFYDYVLWDGNEDKAELCLTGIYKEGEVLFGVYQDDDYIDLILQEEGV